MFEHLPTVTKDDIKAVRKYHMPLFLELANQCTERMEEGKETPDGAMDCVCRGLGLLNPLLVPAVKAVAEAVNIQLREKVEPGLLWRAGMMAIVSVLALLCAIDRALEVKEKGQR